jgi:hypothetical protein
MAKWKSILLMAGMVSLLAGCHGSQKSSTPSASASAQKKDGLHCPFAVVRNEPPSRLNDAPLIVDGAMQLRDWSRSTAFYANGDTIAGPTDFPFEIRRNAPWWDYAFGEAPLMVVQTLMLPGMLIIDPPWEDRRYTGVTIEPTYTAMPAVPPSPAGAQAKNTDAARASTATINQAGVP